MLRKILAVFGEGSMLSTSNLVERVGVPEQLLSPILDDLVRMGYLQLDESCVASCGNCHQASTCGPAQPQRLWQLTPKGQKTIYENVKGSERSR